MTDELAKLTIRHDGEVYRFKVFENIVMVERQPGGDTRIMGKAENEDAMGLYERISGVWDMGALMRLIDAYHRLR